MGTVIIGISYYIQTLTLHAHVIIISIPVAVFIGLILLANNIRDRVGDELNGRKTLAILFGHKGSIRFLTANYTVAYGLTLIFIILGILPLWSILTFISVVKAIASVKGFIDKNQPIEMMPAMKATAQTNTFYGLLLGLSLLLQLYIPLTL